MDYQSILNSYAYRKLRKAGYKSEVSGEILTPENMKVHCKYDLKSIFAYIHSDLEVFYWVLDRMWEDWLVVTSLSETYPSISNSLGVREKQIIDKVIENLKTPLGSKTSYIDRYDPTLLFPVARITSRKEMGYKTNKDVPFKGLDIWNCYEISYLTHSGKPISTMIRFVYDSDSENIVESKSVKLYLNSFNQEKITGDIRKIIKKDIQRATKAKTVIVDYIQDRPFVDGLPGQLLDTSLGSIGCSTYQYDPSLLQTTIAPSQDDIYLSSSLFKSNCRMSGLPDWADIVIHYKPNKVVLLEESLLQYLVSFRNHREFHEPCCERIMTDLIRELDPKYLSVSLQYTRRGGCDINPMRMYSKNKSIKVDYSYWFHHFHFGLRQ